MKSSWRSPDGGSSVARNTEIESCGAVFCARWGTGSTSIRSFHTVSRETVRKGVRAMLRAWIWPLFRDQNGPNGALWVPSKAQFRVPPGLFGQFRKWNSRKFGCRILNRSQPKGVEDGLFEHSRHVS